jgi:tRNA pseudouridine13 synthase
MKLKYQPEDFRVEELPTVSPAQSGRYRYYRLTKRNLGTIEAVEKICRSWNLPGRRVSYAGLKDRHALTIQLLSIVDGPPKSIRDRNFELDPIGKLPHPYGPRYFRGNRFQLVLRDLTPRSLTRTITEIEDLPQTGLPNYFDEQRFGSVGRSGQFIAHAWLLGDHEQALKLALAEPNRSDRSGMKSQKAVLREFWGNWPEAKARLGRSSARSIVTYLVDHPTDYRGAFARLRRELRTLYFSAYQSHVWNLILARWIERLLRPEQVVPIELKTGTFPFPRRIEPAQYKVLDETPIPLPSARNAAPDGTLGEVVQEVLERLQLTWSQIRIRHLKDVFFSKGSRACLLRPENLDSATLPDEFHPGRSALRLSFELPKGSYATILVKRITEVVGSS